ncbi:MAG: MobF family relaxase [Pirellulaceae bacterium]
MLIATQSQNITGTRKYFEQVLTQGDYYLGQEIAGQWHGKGAELFGLGVGVRVTKEQFNNLLKGQHPITGAKLTQRARQDRRPGMDLTFSVPKSVSLAWAINNDERIVEALRQAVRESMKLDVEPLMQRRVRTGAMAFTRQKTNTGKLIYADFLHKTSRPVNGRPDPHLHVHGFVINWTEDGGKHFAGEMEEIVRQRASLQAKFEARLARKLQYELGYEVQATQYLQSGKIKHGWELKGLDRRTIEKFSRRTDQVERAAKKQGIRDAAKKAMLGRTTREKKDSSQSVEQLRQEWQSRLTPEEKLAFQRLGQGNQGRGDRSEVGPTNSVAYALAHHLYRQSTVERHQVIATALEHGLTHRPEDIEKALDKLQVIQRSLEVDGTKRHMITTREVLESEQKMIDYAQHGRGTKKAIARHEHQFELEWLNEQQKAAVTHVLETRDAVISISGGAGTGKSSMMQEAAEAVRKQGREVFVFAPSTGAREVLEEKGFEKAQTVEHLIRNTKLHPQLKDQVIWIDEAGLLDVRSMNAVFDIAKEQNARVVLSGDTRQHASPRRGEAMRLLESEAGLSTARIESIQRQRGRYKKAIELISRGHEAVNGKGQSGLLAGFDLLDRLGKIKQIDPDQRCAELAKHYLKSTDCGKSTIVIAPTHGEACEVTTHIREQLKERGELSGDEQEFKQLKSLNLSEAQKGNVSTYEKQEDLIVQFHQNHAGGIQRGERYRIVGIRNSSVHVKRLGDEQQRTLPLSATERFEVYAEQTIRVAVGDKLRFTAGGTSRNGANRISNGRLDEVKGFDKQGNIVLKNGWVVDRDYGHLDLGYCVTSHAAQGKDRQVAIAAMGSQSLPAINCKQFYVTASRGSEDVLLFVDDKQKVRRAIERSGEQLSASELLRQADGESHSQTREWRDLGREARRGVNAFRDRVARWWHSRYGDRQSGREATGQWGRELTAEFSQSFRPTPGLGHVERS